MKIQGRAKNSILPKKDNPGLWGGGVARIFAGVDLSGGFYMVEGSTLLWDELCAFCGVDDKDLQNYVIVAQYVDVLKRLGKLEAVINEQMDLIQA